MSGVFGVTGRLLRWRGGGLLAAVALALGLGLGAAGGQSLAHKGWAGNGITVAPWWEGAVFYAVKASDLPGAGGDEAGVKELGDKLESLQELGVDALVEGGLEQGRAEEFDRVVGEATRRRMRVVVDLPVKEGETGQRLADEARFWLSRGAAGVRLVGDAQTGMARRDERLLEVERVVAGFSGQRVLIWDLRDPRLRDAAPMRVRRGTRRRTRAATTAGSDERVEVDHGLRGWSVLDAAGLRRVLSAEVEGAGRAVGRAARLMDRGDVQDAAGGQQGGQASGVGSGLASAQRVAAALMLGGEAPLLAEGMQGEGELLKWYEALGAVRHGSAAGREGRMVLLYTGNADVVAWVRVARAGGVVSPPMVVVENFSDRPVVLRLGGELRRAGVAVGSGVLRRLAQTADGDHAGGQEAGTASVEALKVEPGGVFVGGPEGAPGLEAAPVAVRRRRR